MATLAPQRATSGEKRFAKPIRATTGATRASERPAPVRHHIGEPAADRATKLASTTSRVTRDTTTGSLRWVAPSRTRTNSAPAAADVAHSQESPANDRPTEAATANALPADEVTPVVSHRREASDRGARRAFRGEGPASRDPQLAEEATDSDPFDDPFQDGTRLTISTGSRAGKVERTVARIVDPTSGEEIETIEGAEPRLTGLQESDGDLPAGLGDPAPAPLPDTQPIEEAIPPSESDLPSLEEQVAQGPAPEFGPCPTPKDLKRIGEITDDITPDGTEFPQECTLGDDMFQPRSWAMTTYHWKAAALCHKPLYFQQVQVERYGHTWPLIQPLVSGANFFLTFPILPYKMGLNPPWECLYPLGYYRPGSCAPYLIGPIPLSVRAGLLEAGAWVGGVYLIP